MAELRVVTGSKDLIVCMALGYRRMAKEGVLVCSGYYNKIPQTGWLINNRHLFSPILGDWRSKIRVLAWSGAGESPLSGCRLPTPHRGLSGRRNKGALSRTSFIRALLSFMRALCSWSNHPPKAQLNTIITGTRISTYEFFVDTNIHSSKREIKEGVFRLNIWNMVIRDTKHFIYIAI